jgi:hypothetical protein
MKKLSVLLIVFTIMAGTAFFYRPAHAASHDVTGGSKGPNCNDGGYFDPGSITINAGDTITFHVPKDDPYPGGIEIHNFPGGNFTIAPGDSHTTPPLVIDIPSYYATWPSSGGCQKGTGSVKVVTPTAPPPDSPAPSPITITNTPAAPPPPTAPPPTAAPPASPKAQEVSVNGDKVDIKKPLSADVSQPITISGYTIANGVVNLTIHSAVRNEIARANSSGYWTYTIENLEPGNHTVEATVTNPATHQTSPGATILKFTLTGSLSPYKNINNVGVAQAKSSSLTSKLPLIAAGILLPACALAVAFWFMKNRKHKTLQTPPKPQITQAPPTQIIAPSQQSPVTPET